MPDYTASGGAIAACPQCGARSRDDVALYAPSGAPLPPDGRRAADQAPDGPSLGQARHVAVPTRAPASPFWQPPTESLHFWQGLTSGLAAGIVVLFLILLAA